MYKVPLGELKEKIRQGAHLIAEELDIKIKGKINELSGLVSEEGAAHIIANEFGIVIVAENGRLKIKDVYAGMKQVEVLGKVLNVFGVREFDKEGRKGKVGNFIIGDDTGTVRVVCWHEQAELLSQLKENDLVLIKSGYAKENNLNQKELHLNERSKVTVNPPGEKVEDALMTYNFFKRWHRWLKLGWQIYALYVLEKAEHFPGNLLDPNDIKKIPVGLAAFGDGRSAGNL